MDTHTPISFPVEPNDIHGLLREYRITPTQQRVQIASFLFSRPQHVTAEQVLQGAKAIGAHVSRATIYNTLGLFIKKGLVKEVIIDRDRVYYDSNNRFHHHIYHVDSGELEDMDPRNIRIQHQAGLENNVKVIGTELILRVTSK